MRVRIALVTIVLLVCVFNTRPSAQSGNAARTVAGEILVKFRPGAGAAAKADAHRAGGGSQLAEIGRTNLQRVSVPRGGEAAAIARYRANPNVLYAEPNYVRRVPEVINHTPGTEVVPGDYYFHEQWALNNTGQEFYCIPFIGTDLCLYVGTADADIDAPEAWAISTGSPSVSVAVIDTGVDYTHPDLAGAYAGGYNYVANNSDPMDDHGHGTHVSGTIAARMDNLTGDPAADEGVVGIAPLARLFAYKVCDANGECTDFAINQAIAQAIADGAKVINMSLGSVDYSQSLDDAVQDAWAAGLVIVAGAGNDSSTELFYPAALPNVVSVAAFDEDGLRASFSNYGSWVDISAPGNVIMSTYPLSACGGLTTTPGDTGCYEWLSGTSMATPHVTGAAALVWSRPDVTSNSQVVDILLSSADPNGVSNVKLNSWTIHGGLNIHNALSLGVTNLSPVANAGADQTLTDADRNGVELVTLNGSGSSDSDGQIVGYEWRESGNVIATGATASVWLAVGVHTISLTVTDDRGATATDSVAVTVTAPNDPPVAATVSASTTVGTPVTITLSAADSGTCELSFAGVQAPASGTLSAIQNQPCVAGSPNLDTALVTYTSGSAGTYAFTYKANDGSLDSNIATVTVTVNPGSAPLTVTGISPNTVRQNAGTVTFAVTGTGFASGATVAFVNGTGSAPRVRSVTFNSSTQLTMVADVKSNGKTTRKWDVKVTNPNGSSATGVGLLTITP